MLRLSTLFLRTLRDDPADAEVPSHRLLVRGGYVRRVAPGIYSWLPLGMAVLANVERIVREEMDAHRLAGGALPGADPAGDLRGERPLGRLRRHAVPAADRKGADYLLAPTHEELFTLLVKGEYSSYKDYPLSLYQIQTKYRDEARPRAGILRGREFIMKDSLLLRPHRRRPGARPTRRTATRTSGSSPGWDSTYRIVFAVSGAMGGSASEEFLAPAAVGRGHLRAVHELRLRREHRGGRDRRARAARPARPPGRAGAGHAGHADDRHAGRRG